MAWLRHGAAGQNGGQGGGGKKLGHVSGKKAVREGEKGTAAGGQEKQGGAGGRGDAEVEPVAIPSHVITDDYCTFWVREQSREQALFFYYTSGEMSGHTTIFCFCFVLFAIYIYVCVFFCDILFFVGVWYGMIVDVFIPFYLYTVISLYRHFLIPLFILAAVTPCR